jgi:hypothetical protein
MGEKKFAAILQLLDLSVIEARICNEGWRNRWWREFVKGAARQDEHEQEYEHDRPEPALVHKAKPKMRRT